MVTVASVRALLAEPIRVDEDVTGIRITPVLYGKSVEIAQAYLTQADQIAAVCAVLDGEDEEGRVSASAIRRALFGGAS